MKKFIALFLIVVPLSVFPQKLDNNILEAIHTPEAVSSDGFFRVMSDSYIYGITGVPVTLAIAGLIRKDNEMLRNAGVIVAGTLIDFGITYGFKYSVKRDRPFVESPLLFKNKSEHPWEDYSFPSGHTSTTFATATSLSLQYPEWYVIVPSFAWASTVAYSRMHLGVHYPTDVLGGVVIGAGSAFLTHYLNKKLFGR